ncbi:hypothetical protein LINPERPRIM_LOCUS6085 [Linum perenne]
MYHLLHRTPLYFRISGNNLSLRNCQVELQIKLKLQLRRKTRMDEDTKNGLRSWTPYSSRL